MSENEGDQKFFKPCFTILGKSQGPMEDAHRTLIRPLERIAVSLADQLLNTPYRPSQVFYVFAAAMKYLQEGMWQAIDTPEERYVRIQLDSAQRALAALERWKGEGVANADLLQTLVEGVLALIAGLIFQEAGVDVEEGKSNAN